MKKYSIVVLCLILLTGCQWELPVEKNSRNCQLPGGVLASADASNGKRYVFTVNGSTADVGTIIWRISNGSAQITQTTKTANQVGLGSFEYTATADGMYNCVAEVTTLCGDKTTFTVPFTVNTQLQVASSYNVTDAMIHSGLSSVAVANDGTILADEQKNIKVWNPFTRTLLRTLRGHTADINWLVLSPNEQYLFSCGDENSIYVWDWKTGSLSRTLTGHSASISRLRISTDGRYLVSISTDKTIRVWDTSTWQTIRAFTIPDGWISEGLAISTTGNYISQFFWSGTGGIYSIAWNYLTGNEVWRQSIGSATFLFGSIFTPNGQQLYVNYQTSSGPRLQVFETNSRQVSRDQTHEYGYNLALSLDGRYLMSGTSLYNFPSLTQVWYKGVIGYTPNSVLSANNQYSAGWVWGAINAWQVPGGNDIIAGESKHPVQVNSVAISRDSRSVATLDLSGQLKSWNLVTGQLQTTHYPQFAGGFSNQLSYTSDNRFIIVTGGTNPKIVNAVDGSLVRTIPGSNPSNFDGNFVAPDGSFFVSGSNSNVVIRDINTGTVTRTLMGHVAWVSAVTVSNDSRQVISASEDNSIRIWDAASGNVMRSFAGQGLGSLNRINALQVSPDNNYIAGISGSRILIWSYSTGQLVANWPSGAKLDLQSLSYSPDSRLVATGSLDGKVYVWNAPSGTPFKEITLTYPVRKVQFSASGNQLYAITEKDFQTLTVR